MGSLLCGVLWLFSVRGNHCPFRRRVRSGGPYEFSRRVDRQLVQPLHPKTTSESIEDRPPSKRGRYCVGASRRSALSNSSTLVLPSYSGPGFLFRFADGRLLSKTRFVDTVREAMTKAGLQAKDYAGHSFRIGAATTAGARGVPDSTIKMLGRWESSAYLLYIRTPRDHLASISAVLCPP